MKKLYKRIAILAVISLVLFAVVAWFAIQNEMESRQIRDGFISGCVEGLVEQGYNFNNSKDFCICAFNYISNKISNEEFMAWSLVVYQEGEDEFFDRAPSAFLEAAVKCSDIILKNGGEI